MTLNSPSGAKQPSSAVAAATPIVPKQEPEQPWSPAFSSSSQVPTSASSPASKRSAVDSPCDSPAPSPKRARIDPYFVSLLRQSNLAKSNKPKYILDGDIIPSSEGDDEVDLMPIERPPSVSTRGAAESLPQTQMSIETTTNVGRLFNNGSLMSSNSEMEVDASLRATGEVSTDPSVGQETDYDGADEEVQGEISDAESDDSARALKQALAADITGTLEDDDDGALFDMSFSKMKTSQSPPSGPERGKKANPQTSSRQRLTIIDGAKRVQRARDTLVTSSPLTHTSSSSKRARIDEDGGHHRIKSKNGNAVTKHGESAEESEVALPLPKPKANTTHLRLSKPSALDCLLKEKKSRQKKYGSLMSPGTVIRDAAMTFASPSQTLAGGTDDSPTPARRFLTPGAEASLDGVLNQPEKIKEILAGDLELDRQEDRHRLEAQRIIRNTFWKDTNVAGMVDMVAAVAAPFPTLGSDTPILKRLQRAAENDELDLVVLFLHSGSLCSEAALSDEVFDWLLNLAVLHGDVEVGSAALGCLRDLLGAPSDAVKEIELDFPTRVDEELSYPLPPSETRRQEQIWRLLAIVQLFAQSRQIYLQDVPRIVLALLLISRDSSTSTSTKTEITKALGMTLKNIERAKSKRGIELEMSVCLDAISLLEERKVLDALEVAHVMPSTDARTIRMSRWIALGVLGGLSVIEDLTQEEYLAPPCLAQLHRMVFGMPREEKPKVVPLSVTTSAVKFVIDPDTNYQDMTACVDMLGLVLTDVGAFMRAEPKTFAEKLEKLVQGLATLMARIQDNRGSQLDRTRTKDELHRLRVRLSYQLTSRHGGQSSLLGALGIKRAPVQKGLRDFFTKA
ncbi:hypothetical protein FRB97_007571 [Tulasnella sp. 331]|nr:hypothetical protein FRB97_007571 [Tulasnella sp. 331]